MRSSGWREERYGRLDYGSLEVENEGYMSLGRVL